MSIEHLKNALGPVPQTEQAHPSQAPNHAGGFSFVVDDWSRLDRFLILGSEGGTFYVDERKLSRENALVVLRLALADGARLVRRIVEISESGRAPKNNPAIFALAIAANVGVEDPEARHHHENTRQLAYEALPKVCRTGTHLYHFVAFVESMGHGWGRGMRRAVAKWFNEKSASDLAYQLVKYQQRDGWAARDLIKLAHPHPATPDHGAIYRWARTSYDDCLADGLVLPATIQAFEEAKTCDVKRLISLIRDYGLPREAIPTQHLNNVEVWDALLRAGKYGMPPTALIRNLAKMTAVGLIAPLSDASMYVAARLADGEALRRSRVHPMAVLIAAKMYGRGHGLKGELSWTPVQVVNDALDAAFYGSFGNVVPVGKPMLLALDVSGSMTSHSTANGLLSCREAAAAMALVTAHAEPNYHLMGFSHHFVEVPINKSMRLAEACHVMGRIPYGATDCSLPFEWAIQTGAKPAGFVVYTDNETFRGARHPHIALQDYRRRSGVDARSVVVGMVATAQTIADPSDAGMMDVVGFDAALPAIISDFVRGEATPVEKNEDEE
jgi:60 kDa SS-A/Ro ribonucleoprotein